MTAVLHEAASNGDLLSLEHALKEGNDPNEVDMHWGRRSPLHIAAMCGHKKIAYVLIQAGANVNAVTDSGWTPAHFACESGHSQVLSTLINNGNCDLNIKDNSGHTPKDIATIYNHTECIALIDEHIDNTKSLTIITEN